MNSNMEIKIGIETIESFRDIAANFIDLSAAVKHVTKCVTRCILKKELSEEDTSILEMKIMEAIIEQIAKYRDYEDTTASKINITFN